MNRVNDFEDDDNGNGYKQVEPDRAQCTLCFIFVRQRAAPLHLSAQYDSFKVHGDLDFGTFWPKT